jgi:heptosyltransferase-2
LKAGRTTTTPRRARQPLAPRIFGVSGRIISPKITRILGGPLLYGGGKSQPSEFSVQDSRNILVVRLDTIGDLVLTSPFLRELRLSNPNAWITMVVDPRFVNLVELCPHVNEVLTFDPLFMGRTGRLPIPFRALRFARAYLWPRKFDFALLPRWGSDVSYAASVAYFSRAACRVGYSENVSALKQRLNRDFDGLFTRTLDDRKPKHEVERNLDFLRAVGGTPYDDRLELWLGEEDREHALKALASRGVRHSDLVIGMAPGAGHPKRLWPIDRFIELGRFLAREFGARLLLVGGPHDRDTVSRLTEALGASAVSVSGEMTLRQTAALLTQTRLMVSNDSGPMHLAAAAGAAVLEISCHPAGGDPGHENSPVRFHPWTKQYAVLQPPEPIDPCVGACERHDAHCILGVSFDAARTAARRLLAHQDALKSAKIETDMRAQ